MPPADELKKYSKLNPKFVSILLKDFEKNSEHIRKTSLKALEEDIKFSNKSQNHGFIATMSMIIGTLVCAYFKQTAIGIALVGIYALGIIKALLPNKEK